MKEAFQKLETVVSLNYSWTATCRFSDIVLPACTPFERNDIDAYGSYSNRGVLAMHKLVEPMYEARSDFEIFKGLCERFGKAEEYCRGMDEMEWVERLYRDCRNANRGKFEMPPCGGVWKKKERAKKPPREDPQPIQQLELHRLNLTRHLPH